jgi:shikimate dehydrogenase
MLRVKGTSRVLAIVGDPVGHSLSPEMHNAAMAALGLDAVYIALRVPAPALATFFPLCANMGISGNVTVPHKAQAVLYMTRVSDRARALGAVNVFWPEEDGLRGDNTDVAGLDEVLEVLGAPDPWLLCGTGGSARAVAAVAGQRAASLVVRSRSPDRARAFADWARGLSPAPSVTPDDGRQVATVINATPLGLSAADPAPLAPERIAGARVALDLVYRPGETAWVRACRAAGLTAVDGRGVLVAQGAHAFECFFPGRRAPRELMRAAVERALRG